MTGAPLTGRQRRVWLAVVAVLLAAVAAVFAPPPPALADAGAGGRSFAALASAAIVALSILPFLASRGATPPRMWLAAAVAALALGVGSFAAGGYAQRACTTRYGDKTAIIGTALTPLGAAYKQANPALSSDDLLFDAAGVPERIWTRSSIGRCRIFISSTYFLWIPFLVICLLAAAQAVPTAILSPVRWDALAPQAGPATPTRYDVFLSYRHDGVDRNFANELVDALEAHGYRVAIDERDFPANASFLQEMERCVRESRFTVAVISSRYLESGNCQEEAIICKVLDMGDRKRRLIPMVIEPVSMPAWLYGIVGIDCTKRDPLVDPFEKLRATLGAPLGSAARPSEGQAAPG
jgi:hypothetical protein